MTTPRPTPPKGSILHEARRLRVQSDALHLAQVILNQSDDSRDDARTLIYVAGYKPDDKDMMGNEIRDTVQTLLECAIHLAPKLSEAVDAAYRYKELDK